MSYSRIQQRANLNAIRAKTLQVALYSSNPTALDVGNEITGGGYTRQSVTFNVPQDISDGSYIANTSLISFPVASGDYSAPITHFAAREVGGPLTFFGTTKELGMDTSRTIRTGDVFRIAANTLIHKEQD